MRYAWDRHDRLSAICALTIAPCSTRHGLYYDVYSHNVRSLDVVEFLSRIHHHVRRRVILVCDRWSVHRKAAKELTNCSSAWFDVSWLPSYAPELDPVEFVWNQAKYVDLVNWIPESINQVQERLVSVFEAYRKTPNRLNSFFHAAHLE